MLRLGADLEAQQVVAAGDEYLVERIGVGTGAVVVADRVLDVDHDGHGRDVRDLQGVDRTAAELVPVREVGGHPDQVSRLQRAELRERNLHLHAPIRVGGGQRLARVRLGERRQTCSPCAFEARRVRGPEAEHPSVQAQTGRGTGAPEVQVHRRAARRSFQRQVQARLVEGEPQPRGLLLERHASALRHLPLAEITVDAHGRRLVGLAPLPARVRPG